MGLVSQLLFDQGKMKGVVIQKLKNLFENSFDWLGDRWVSF